MMFCLTPKTSASIWVSVFNSMNTVTRDMDKPGGEGQRWWGDLSRDT